MLRDAAEVRPPLLNGHSLLAEFVKCVSAEELRARLASGRPFSAALVDATLPAFDRDLVDLA
ncbi:MAG: hypothetical protein M3P53_06925, partial [Actinomycetota bacterium]|nr:hypothetical protein [Actinomycetota bacterium]